MGVVLDDSKNWFQCRKINAFPLFPEGPLPPRRENNQRSPCPPKQTTPHCLASAGLSPGPGYSPANTRGKGGRTRAPLGPTNRFAPSPKAAAPGATRAHPHPGRAGVPQPPTQPAAQAQARPRGPPPSPTRRPSPSGTPSHPRGTRRAERTDPIPSPPARNREEPGIYLSLPTPGDAFTPLLRRPERRWAVAAARAGGGAGRRGAGRREAAAGTARERLR